MAPPTHRPRNLGPVRRAIDRLPPLPVVFYAHPFELALGIVLVVNALRAFTAGDVSPALDSALPPSIRLVYQTASLLGGIGVLAGLRYRAHPPGRVIERSALILMGCVYASFVVVLVGTYGPTVAWSSATNAAAIAAACGLRARAIRKAERVILHQLRSAKGDPAALRRLVDGRPPLEEDS